MEFQPHGSHSFKIEGPVLVVYTRGPWNLEEIEAYTRDQKSNVTRLAGNPWVVLAHVFDLGLHTPDAFNAMIETVREHRKQGRVATALILEVNDSIKSLVETRFTEIYSRANEPHKFFNDEVSARAWLKNQLSDDII